MISWHYWPFVHESWSVSDEWQIQKASKDIFFVASLTLMPSFAWPVMPLMINLLLSIPKYIYIYIYIYIWFCKFRMPTPNSVLMNPLLNTTAWYWIWNTGIIFGNSFWKTLFLPNYMTVFIDGIYNIHCPRWIKPDHLGDTWYVP